MNYRPNSEFANYVTNIAFHLSLSRSMCALLLALQVEMKRKDVSWMSETTGFGDFIPCVRALERRGLVKYYPEGKMNGKRKHHHILTKEGELVAQLVELAGLNMGRHSVSHRKAA